VSAVPFPRHKRDEQLELLREIRDLLKDMLADRRRRFPLSAVTVPALLGALTEHYGPARFTVRMVLDVAAENPHGALAEALAAVVNMNGSPRSVATSLGALLSRLPEIEVVAEQRGASLYRLRTYPA
jgi:histidine ammonia-lyase